jgi:hypothetical protein
MTSIIVDDVRVTIVEHMQRQLTLLVLLSPVPAVRGPTMAGFDAMDYCKHA